MHGKRSKFYKSFWYLQKQSLLEGLDVFVARVNPETNTVDDDDSLNTKEQVWLEFGRTEMDTQYPHIIHMHYWQLDCGASTFEKAIIKGAKKAKIYFKEHPEDKR